MKEYNNLNWEKEGHIAVLTLNNAPVNAITFALCDDLMSALVDQDVWCIVVKSALEKVFCAGADVRNLEKCDRFGNIRTSNSMRKPFLMLENFRCPVICAVDGVAFGGGLELALACDLRVFGPTAKAAFPESGLGICPGAGGTQRLTRLIGIGAAKRLIYTGEAVNAEEAYRLGLCEYVASEGQTAAEKAMEIAEKICTKAPKAIAADKVAINYAADNHSLSDGLTFETIYTSDIFATEDQKEGTSAFFEKRRPEFHNK